jgi:signal transduction histidine kinase
VAGDSGKASSQADEQRRIVPAFALAVAVLAIVTNPGTGLDFVLAAVPVVAFGVWAYFPRVPLLALSVVVVAAVVASQRNGEVEPLMFDISLLAFVVARWSPALSRAVALGLLAAATPVLAAIVQDPAEVAVGIWLLGIAFPWVVGRFFIRQEALALQLESTRRELAEQTMLAERRRIARDVHDFVGHGLAAVMLQVTSARHVLRRDPDAAEEALRAAENMGRRSMAELRRTVALLRSDDDARAIEPPPSVAEIANLVEHAREGGLAVELRSQGNLDEIPPGVGVAVYRIAQEALANAVRHAPAATTVIALDLADGHVQLVADTTGPLVDASAAASGRAGYGLIGMRERATALGGDFAAGRTAAGWRVTCRLPATAGEEDAT